MDRTLLLLNVFFVLFFAAECGDMYRRSMEVGNRIVGGSVVPEGEIPWQVSISTKNIPYCGGAIITRRHILTAAHCLEGVAQNSLKVLSGTTYKYSGKVHIVKKATKHPVRYNRPFSDDIAILEVYPDFQFNTYTQPVNLPEPDFEPQVGLPVTVSGWGRLTQNGAIPDVLQKTNLAIISRQECSKLYNKPIYNNQICTLGLSGSAYSPVRDACQGDSGGPLTYGNILIGVVSWGVGCANPHYPGVFTKVSFYTDWIRNTVSQV